MSYQGGKKVLFKEREKMGKDGTLYREFVARIRDGNDVYLITFNNQNYETSKTPDVKGGTGVFKYGYAKKYKNTPRTSNGGSFGRSNYNRRRW